MNYFANKKERITIAKNHTEKMGTEYKTHIETCAKKSEILEQDSPRGGSILSTFPVTDLKNVHIVEMTTTDAIFDEDRKYNERLLITDAVYQQYGTRFAVLNFASFKNPGGLFMGGCMAQEESLCHASFLYNVLSQFQDTFYTPNKALLNRGLYTNRGIYSPDVIFELEHSNGSIEYTSADVFTIAAPNAGVARRNGVLDTEISYELSRRIRFVIRSMLDHGPYLSVILGAFGCGVFKNDPEIVAKMFFKELDNMECRDKFYRVIFAIVGDNNIQPFRKILTERRESFGKN